MILKNVTLSTILINDVGISIPASSSYTIQVMDRLLWQASIDVATQISAGNIVVNDGSIDLPISEGIAYISNPQNALGERFNYAGFAAKNVQAAIVEASTMGGSGSGFNEDKILCNQDFDSLYDQDGNILIGE